MLTDSPCTPSHHCVLYSQCTDLLKRPHILHQQRPHRPSRHTTAQHTPFTPFTHTRHTLPHMHEPRSSCRWRAVVGVPRSVGAPPLMILLAAYPTPLPILSASSKATTATAVHHATSAQTPMPLNDTLLTHRHRHHHHEPTRCRCGRTTRCSRSCSTQRGSSLSMTTPLSKVVEEGLYLNPFHRHRQPTLQRVVAGADRRLCPVPPQWAAADHGPTDQRSVDVVDGHVTACTQSRCGRATSCARTWPPCCSSRP